MCIRCKRNRCLTLTSPGRYLLEKDNEENAVICLRIILDLHKNFRPHLEAEVQPFLDFVRQIYQNFPSTVNEFFSSIDSAQYAMHHGQAGPSASVGGGSKSGALNKSTESFKVLTECPLIVMFLFQLYPKHLQTNIPVLLPLMVRLWLRCLRQMLTPIARDDVASALAVGLALLSHAGAGSLYLARGASQGIQGSPCCVPRLHRSASKRHLRTARIVALWVALRISQASNNSHTFSLWGATCRSRRYPS